MQFVAERRALEHIERVASTKSCVSPCARWRGRAARVLDSDGRRVAPHRLVYRAFVGALADSDVVVRTCSTPDCVAPAHLRAASCARNTRTADERARDAARRTSLVRMFDAHAAALHTLLAYACPDEQRPRMPAHLVAEARAARIDVARYMVDEAPRDDVPELEWRASDDRARRTRGAPAARCADVACPCKPRSTLRWGYAPDALPADLLERANERAGRAAPPTSDDDEFLAVGLKRKAAAAARDDDEREPVRVVFARHDGAAALETN